MRRRRPSLALPRRLYGAVMARRHPIVTAADACRALGIRRPPAVTASTPFHRGHCPVCGAETVFVVASDWLRDDYRCCRCGSIPRQRAIAAVLRTDVPDPTRAVAHEPSASRPTMALFESMFGEYSVSRFVPERRSGEIVDGVRCENLEQMSFPDNTFDVFITQDVFEHIFDFAAAVREIHRVLRPGGLAVWTVPTYGRPETVVRAVRRDDGTVEHLLAPQYHDDPDGRRGSLVVRDWGLDHAEQVAAAAPLEVRRIDQPNHYLGIDGHMVDVFAARKAAH